MADRGMSAAMIAEVSAGLVHVAYLVEAEPDSGALRYTDYMRPLVYSGDTYTAAGGLLSFAGLQETGELLVNQISVTLSGVDTSEAMARFLVDDFLDRPLRIYVAFIDDDGTIIASPVKIFEGRMDAPTIQEDPDTGSSTVQVAGTPQWVNFGRKPGRHTNDEEQQFYFSGDKFFEFVSALPKSIKWGRT